jgi:alpha-D-xyloside xylohydrolase
VDFWTGRSQEGGQTLSAAAPLGTIPLFVRAGSVLPFGPELQYANEKPADPIELRVYPGTDGSFTLYEDEGDGYGYEKGRFATIPFTWNDREKTLTIGARTGGFPGMLKTRTFRVVLVRDGHGTGDQFGGKPDAEVRYQGQPLKISLQGR